MPTFYISVGNIAFAQIAIISIRFAMGANSLVRSVIHSDQGRNFESNVYIQRNTQVTLNEENTNYRSRGTDKSRILSYLRALRQSYVRIFTPIGSSAIMSMLAIPTLS